MAQIFTRSFDDDGQRRDAHAYTHYSVIHIEEEENQGTTSQGAVLKP